jgi:uncharacterized protein YcbK (DUF882 family)
MKITPNFALEEFASRDGTEYPSEWIETRLRPLCETLEVVRAAGGGTIHIDSGYRTLAYDQKLYDDYLDKMRRGIATGTVAPPTSSQHPKGRAADIKHAVLQPHELFNLVLGLYHDGQLPQLGGVGLYPSFVHVDVRQRAGSNGGANDGHLSIWGGTRPSNIL